ncbi:MAG: DUF5615 family PIN-like protein [Bacteroidetes bacterium]|nr:DUF5615 family PIN-like protein [Bacteroidota bacterium]
MPGLCFKIDEGKINTQSSCMKFIVDAQLPREIAWMFNNRGFDAIHTDDLPDKEMTTDNQIIDLLKSCNLVEMDNNELIGLE